MLLEIIEYSFIGWKIIFWVLKYMAMAVIGLFVGPGKTIHKLAAGKTERMTGLPYTQSPELYKVNIARATASIIFGWLMWGIVIYIVYFLLYCQ